MNELKATINFTKQTFVINGVDLISGDYNSTKITFNFEDSKEGTKILEIRPKDSEDKNPTFMGEIINNEVILVSKDSEEHSISPFTNGGVYLLEVSVYGDDSKLSTITKSINVLPEQIILSDDIVTPYLPIFDELIQEINTAITETNNLNITITKDNGITTVTLTKKDGTTSIVTIKDGIDGVDGVGIESITKVSTSGLVDTYRITLTDSSYYDYQVVNGRGIVSIVKTDTTNYTDTYTITYNDGTTSTFTVTNGTLTIPELYQELNYITNILPKVSETGSDITLNNTGDSRLINLEIEGKSEQNGTPTPDSPIAINSVGTYNSSTNKYDISIKTSGKNLWGGFSNTFSVSGGGVTFTSNSDGSITLNGTATANISRPYSDDAVNNNWYLTLQASTYTISCNNLPSGVTLTVTNTTGNNLYTRITTSRTFTLTSETSIFVRADIPTGISIDNKTIYIQIEEGTATAYEPYKSNTQVYKLDEPLRSIGEIKDLLYIRNGILYVDRKIGSVILNGSEDYSISTADLGSGVTRFSVSITGLNGITYQYDDTRGFSNYFTYLARYSGSLTIERVYVSQNTLIFVTTVASSSSGLKTWLASHNTEVQYLLASSYIEEVGEVNYPDTFSSITNITTSDPLNPNIKATALKDISNL